MGLKPLSLADGAHAVIAATDVLEKTTLASALAAAWFDRRLSRARPGADRPMPKVPGRPVGLRLVSPKNLPKRALKGEAGRIALLHALAHIELNAVDLAFDIMARFSGACLPLSFFDDWMTVGKEEAAHFTMLRDELMRSGSEYGTLPAHAGLWEAAQSTKDDLTARLAIVPLVLEARGLDVTPSMIVKADAVGDTKLSRILNRIYEDEKKHVYIGAKWFRFLCDREGKPAESTFHMLVRRHFRSPLKPPFNDTARSAAGLTPGFYRPLETVRT